MLPLIERNSYDDHKNVRSRNARSRTAIIAGGVVGGVGGLGLISLLVVFLIRQHRQQSGTQSNNMTISEYTTGHPSGALSPISFSPTAKRPMHQSRSETSEDNLSTLPHRDEAQLASEIAALRSEVADIRHRPSVAEIVDISAPPPQYERHVLNR